MRLPGEVVVKRGYILERMSAFLTSYSAWLISPPSTYNIADNSGHLYLGNTRMYHEPGCSQVPGINPAHRVCLSSRAEAEAAGYVHCKKC
jgi:hypothetical protein